MNTFADRLQAVREQVTRLMREHAALHQKAAEQETRAHEHQRMCEVLEARVAELERENEVLRRARHATGGPADPGTKERIDELVHEIDHCLALLGPEASRQ